jgi:two-component system, NtrC family, sensor histidine kinase HydH
MNRRLRLLVNSPALLLGIGLVGACVVSLWAIGSVQSKLQESFQHHVASLRAAHDMEVTVRRLRLDALLERMEPNDAHRASIQADHRAFDNALHRVRELSGPEDRELIGAIETGYRRYLHELESTDPLPADRAGVLRWLESHPVQHVAAPCSQLLDANQQEMEGALHEGMESSREVRRALFVLAVIAPLGGLICGYSIDRLLRRSIARLQVRVQDVHCQVAPEISVVDLKVGEGLDSLHGHLDFIIGRVGKLVERLQAQQREIVRSEQLALAGQLASGIAHEIRNPLTSIRWLVEGAVRSYPEEPLTLDDLRVMQSETVRVEGAVQGLLDFVRPARAHRTECDLREVIRQVVELTRARRRQTGVTCGLSLPSEPVLAHVDPGQIKSVLVNLLLNALDAMPQGGHVNLRLDTGKPSEARLIIEDTGNGIPPEVLDRLFLPFTSTKPNGTGLGLNVAWRIVEEHGGRLSAENRHEGGARFVVTLPA